MRHLEEHKITLTPGEKIRVAHAVLVWGWEEHKVAALMNVDPARVTEAVGQVRESLHVEATGAVSVLERKMLRQNAHDLGLRAVEQALNEEPDAG